MHVRGDADRPRGATRAGSAMAVHLMPSIVSFVAPSHDAPASLNYAPLPAAPRNVRGPCHE
ncbi:hypothetical protein [Lysobacter gummosus]|uniref:hypothetical protein n=1 Tax=Lysobacter gummosus TaxID=262324 RepID=UPI00363B3CFA